ncbi:MAG: peptide-methionine (S)-S-oxide reductase MsrA [Bacteroidetes bacterium]|nr:peptide-methionine (S)-S-oxide reductase MsrA [Bacteroidota bacterium]MBS1648807.1 peptide-methionine (S)-S-oxide reductase MsrA [Bacteroidota bacterium]
MLKIFITALLANTVLLTTAQQYNKTERKMTNTNKNRIAYFGEGCFWCTEAFFERLEGVISVTSGYGGGFVENPTYEQVCDKTTGHTEITKIIYAPTKITYDELLEVFWKTHDPTTPNQQGADKGPQYRSVIFYLTDEEKQKAEHYKTELNKSGAWSKPIVTAIEPFKNFYPAENYHQDYYNNNTEQGYCKYVIAPKLEKFEKVFKNKLKKH